MKQKVMFILGTRPEAIKMAPVIRSFKEAGHYETIVVATGQHREMLAQVLNFFEIQPDVDMGLMVPNQTLPELTAKALAGSSSLIVEHQPAIVLVQGDTSTAFAGGLAAFLNKVPVAHIEAGLRSGRMDSPFPEEANRVLLSKITSLHLAPTRGAADNLNGEAIDQGVHVVGNTVVDALLQGLEIIRSRGEESYFEKFEMIDFEREVILITIHRRESFGEPIKEICKAIRTIASRHMDKTLVYPVHPNPNVRNVVETELAGIDNLRLLNPLEYSDFIWMMSKSSLILTDSGGVQEEAPTLGIPVLVAREVTERSEGVDAGAAVMVGSDADLIVRKADELLALSVAERAGIVNPYGDGKTSSRILELVGQMLS
ncbi:MAG: UDP-N-acetylglucosamine 2-epimerase (non-hydrolyzing) [Akkermansiaceae bacterium]|nr:UDP-N-acetylglucosamine 2-epimerase (non-hydrolyzing) [Akkermansiaceae bacterium]